MSSVSVREQQHMMHVMALNYQTKKKANDGTKQTYLPADRQTADRQTHRQTEQLGCVCNSYPYITATPTTI